MTPHRLGTCEAHPRVSGENKDEAGTRLIKLGSSPRERGKHHPITLTDGQVGLIPA